MAYYGRFTAQISPTLSKSIGIHQKQYSVIVSLSNKNLNTHTSSWPIKQEALATAHGVQIARAITVNSPIQFFVVIGGLTTHRDSFCWDHVSTIEV